MGKIVKTLQGAIEGCEGQDLNGNKFYKFLGIPYAKPPVGDLRFKDPQAADSWVGVKDATKEGGICYHQNDITRELTGSEDCLYLNVFTRDLPDESEYLKPVMVWIHGGAFLSGSSSQEVYGPEFLVSEDIVLVSINYRLGLLGFLQIKDPSLNITGNMGFKDQVEALRWVKGNIRKFNGDPDNVTIFGESAGAASVHYHVLSPLSRGLFHKAILQSAAALNPWADESDHNAVQIAQIHDTNVKTQVEALKVLRELPVEELFKVQTIFLSKAQQTDKIWPIGLTIEPPSKKTAFMNRRPIDIITSGEYNKVPMIFGYNNREAASFCRTERIHGGTCVFVRDDIECKTLNVESYCKELDAEFCAIEICKGVPFNELRKRGGITDKLVPEKFIHHKVNFKNDEAARKKYINKLNNLYLSGPDEDDNNALIMSDALFIAGIIGSAKNHAQTSAYPVYLYKLSLDTKLNFLKMVLNVSHIPGCFHGDDLGYLFKTAITPPIEPDSVENINLRRILKLWTNFARSSNPTGEESELGVTWKPVKARQINVLHIKEDLKMEINPDSERIDLWREMYYQSPDTIKYL